MITFENYNFDKTQNCRQIALEWSLLVRDETVRVNSPYLRINSPKTDKDLKLLAIRLKQQTWKYRSSSLFLVFPTSPALG